MLSVASNTGDHRSSTIVSFLGGSDQSFHNYFWPYWKLLLCARRLGVCRRQTGTCDFSDTAQRMSMLFSHPQSSPPQLRVSAHNCFILISILFHFPLFLFLFPVSLFLPINSQRKGQLGHWRMFNASASKLMRLR